MSKVQALLRQNLAVKKRVRLRCQKCRRVLDTLVLSGAAGWVSTRALGDRPTGAVRPSEVGHDFFEKAFGREFVPYHCHRRCGRLVIVNAAEMSDLLAAVDDEGQIFA